MHAGEHDDVRPQASSDIVTAAFSTPSVGRQERNISPDFRFDKVPNLQELPTETLSLCFRPQAQQLSRCAMVPLWAPKSLHFQMCET